MKNKIFFLIMINLCILCYACSASSDSVKYDAYEYVDKVYDIEQHDKYGIDKELAIEMGVYYLTKHLEKYDKSVESYFLHVTEYDNCYTIAMSSKALLLDDSVAIDITKNGEVYGPHW